VEVKPCAKKEKIMMNRTYKTLDGAYTRADKLGAKSFGADFYGNPKRVDEAVSKVFNTQASTRLAKHNLVKLDKTLYALECTKESAYKWTVVGTFDSDGLLYPAVAGEYNKVIEAKPRAPRKASKGKVVLGKADKKAIRSECYKLAKGDRAMYDKLCKERGVDNHR
jgi:hypothetical protein